MTIREFWMAHAGFVKYNHPEEEQNDPISRDEYEQIKSDFGNPNTWGKKKKET